MGQLDIPMQAFPCTISPLLLSDRLIALAEAADIAGYTTAAEQLVSLAYAVLDEAPIAAH